MLKKYNDILNEKKDAKAEKSNIEEKIKKLFKDKPSVKASSEAWPNAKCIYGLANIKSYVGGDNLKTDQVFNDMLKDKKIKSIKVKINAYGESYPYYYHEDYTTKEEAEKCKVDMEKSQKPVVKKAVKPVEPKEKKARAPRTPRAAKTTEPKETKAKKPVTEKDLKAKAKVVIRRKRG